MEDKKSDSTATDTIAVNTRPTRTKILLFAFPLLLAWSVILNRRTATSTPIALPSKYSICSYSKSLPSIQTIDSNNSIINCLVIKNGLIIDRGNEEDVIRDWGDSESKGSEHYGLKNIGETGLKVIRIGKTQTILPGL